MMDASVGATIACAAVSTVRLPAVQITPRYASARSAGVVGTKRGVSTNIAGTESSATVIESEDAGPCTVRSALEQFYRHYADYDEGLRKRGEQRVDLFSEPPVFPFGTYVLMTETPSIVAETR